MPSVGMLDRLYNENSGFNSLLKFWNESLCFFCRLCTAFVKLLLGDLKEEM